MHRGEQTSTAVPTGVARTTFIPSVHQEYVWDLVTATEEGLLHSYNDVKDLAQTLLQITADFSHDCLADVYAQMDAPN